MAEVLAKQPRPKGPRLTIVTNAGGPSVIATDMLIGSGAQLAELTPETMAAFNAILPPTWSHNNPVDIIGDAKPELYAKSLEIAAKDPNTDGMLVILTPQAMTDPTATAECLKPYAQIPNKPVHRELDGRGHGGERRGHSQRRADSDVQISRPRGEVVLLHVALQ